MERPTEQTGGLDETAVVKRARSGDFRAFAELVGRYEASIFRLARHFTLSQADVEEMFRGTFLDAYADLNRSRDTSRFRPWLIQIAVKRARNSDGVVWRDELSGAAGTRPC